METPSHLAKDFIVSNLQYELHLDLRDEGQRCIIQVYTSDFIITR